MLIGSQREKICATYCMARNFLGAKLFIFHMSNSISIIDYTMQYALFKPLKNSICKVLSIIVYTLAEILKLIVKLCSKPQMFVPSIL
jgi:hypothetical protein